PRLARAAADQARPGWADRVALGRREGQGADNRRRLRAAAGRPGRTLRGGSAARRTPGPARPRRHPCLQPVVRAGRHPRPARADPDRPLAEDRAVSAELRARLLVGGAIASAAVLIGIYLAAGGTSYVPAKTQDPCKHRPWRNPEGLDQIAEQFSLSALD